MFIVSDAFRTLSPVSWFMTTVEKTLHFMTYGKQRESRNQGPAINLKGTYPVTYFLMLGHTAYISNNFQNTTNCRVPSIEGKIRIHAITFNHSSGLWSSVPSEGM